MNAKPKAKNRTPQRHVSTIHSINTLTVSRERQKPASNIVKPTCIPKTRNAATSVQTVLSGLTMSFPFKSGSAAKTFPKPRRSGKSATIPISSKPTPTIFPVSSSIPYLRHSLSCSRTCNREIFCDRDNLFFMCTCLLKMLGGSDFMFSQGCGDRRWICLGQTDYVHYRAKLLSQVTFGYSTPRATAVNSQSAASPRFSVRTRITHRPRNDKDLPVAELPCKSSIDDCSNSCVFDLIRNDHFDFNSWDKLDLVFRAAV